MSTEAEKQEAGRWLSQAQADVRAAEGSLSLGVFEWACFQAQQAAEKALKALWFYHGEDPWGHSVSKLVADFPEQTIRTQLQAFGDRAKALDKLYIPTRYPNGLPGLTPSQAFTESEARAAIGIAREIVDDMSARMR